MHRQLSTPVRCPLVTTPHARTRRAGVGYFIPRSGIYSMRASPFQGGTSCLLRHRRSARGRTSRSEFGSGFATLHSGARILASELADLLRLIIILRNAQYIIPRSGISCHQRRFSPPMVVYHLHRKVQHHLRKAQLHLHRKVQPQSSRCVRNPFSALA